MSSGYIPANLPGAPTMFKGYQFNGKDIGWWSNNSMFEYDKLLISAFHAFEYCKNNNITPQEFKSEFGIRDDVFILADSGGFTNSTLGDQDLDPLKVLEFEEAVGDIGMSLDYPPYNLTDDSKPFNLPLNEFDVLMEKSYQNAKIMAENRKNPNMKYYVCLHGDNIERLERWWNKHKDIPCDGYALAPKDKSDYWGLAQTLLWLYEKGVRKNVHLLAFSGTKTIPILVWWSKLIENITYDSSAWSGAAVRRAFIMPMLKTHVIIGEKKNKDLKEIPCNCAVCEEVGSVEKYMETKYGGALMSMHGLKMYLQYDKLLHSIKHSEDDFVQVVRTYCGVKVIKCLEYIKYGLEKGRDKADYKYAENFRKVTIPTQSKLFSLL